MTQPSTPTSAQGAQLASTSLVAIVADNWVSVRAYFMEAQMAHDETTHNEVAARLPQVEGFLQVMQDALLQERATMTPPTRARQAQIAEKDDMGGRNSATSSFISSLATHSQSYYGNGTTAELADSLPPCYAFLWSDAALISRPEEGSAEAEGRFSPIGDVFLLSLCQFAKHNDPPGSRLIILRFLANVLSKADLPRLPHMTSPPRSLLQMFPTNTVVPLMDMMCQIGMELRSSTVGGEDTSAGLASTASGANIDMMYDERVAFLALLCVIAQKLEQVPALAAFFLPAGTEDGVPRKADLVDAISFFLLRDLLLHIDLLQGPPQLSKRNEVCQLALRGLLSLAKCPDATLQEYMKRHTFVASLTLSKARTTLLTLCKVPDNDDGAAQLIFLCDMLCFWSQLLLFAPAVAEAWRMEKYVEDGFVRETLLPLFCHANDAVYAAVATVTARTVDAVGRAPPFYVSTLTRALLSAYVDPPTGRAAQGSVNGENSSPSLVVSFLDYTLLPRLVVQQDGINCRCVEATLYLLQTLALYEPTLFMEFALSLSVSTLGEVYVKGLCRSATPRPKLTSGGGDDDNAENNHNDLIAAGGEGFPGSLPLPSSSSSSVVAVAVTDTKHVDCYQMQELDVDLSAASTSPPLDVSECFPVRLRATRGALLADAEYIVEGIVARLLLLESHVPTEVLEMRQRVINRTCRNASRKFVRSLLECDHRGVSSAETFAMQDENVLSSGSKNIWFHEGVHRSSLVKQLCELTSHILTIPSSVSSLLTNLWSTLCVLPDLRVLYTLLDPECGRLRRTLLHLRDVIDKGMQDDEDMAFALASAAAALATGKTEKVTPPVSSAEAHEEPRGYEVRKNTNLICSGTVSCLYTRSYLYSQFTRMGPSLRWVRGVVELESTNHEFLTALRRHRTFLEACVCVEGFRMELDAVVGHVELSHNLMCLQTGN